MRSPFPFLAFLAALLASPLLQAQVVLDHFTGTGIDLKTWSLIDSRVNMTVGNSRLRFTGPPLGKHFGIVTLDAFRDDFDFILDFENFQTTSTVSDASVDLTVVDADGPFDRMGELQIKLSGTVHGRQFECQGQKNSISYGKASAPTVATAGELRLVRTQQLLTAAYRPRGAKSWITLKTWSNFLGRLVYVLIDGETAQTGTSLVECDKISHFGRRVTAPVLYGSLCHGLEARPWSIPYYGNQTFGLYADGTGALAGRSTFLMVGIGAQKKIAMSLAPWGAPGCTLLAFPDLILPGPVLDPNGTGVAYLPIPNDANLVGLPFYGQLSAQVNLNAMNMIWSNGVDSAVQKP